MSSSMTLFANKHNSYRTMISKESITNNKVTTNTTISRAMISLVTIVMASTTKVQTMTRTMTTPVTTQRLVALLRHQERRHQRLPINRVGFILKITRWWI